MGAFSRVKSKGNVFPAPMAHRAAPISVSVALDHAFVNAVNATVGDWSTFPLHSHTSRGQIGRADTFCLYG